MTPTTEITWSLRQLMFDRGMFHTTDLVAPLHERGVALSREQVFRLVTRTPQRLSMPVLAALCDILDCTPNDLITVTPVAAATSNARTGTDGTSLDPIGDLRPTRATIRRPHQP